MIKFIKMIGIFLFCLSTCCFAATLHRVVVFGDSLSDNGNLYELMDHQVPLSPPYYQGRFTNGPVWIELLLQSYYPKDAATHLLDYAFGGSGVDGPTTEFDENVITLRSEIDSYLVGHNDQANEDTLYVIWMGANNYLIFPDDIDQAVKDTNWGIQEGVKRLVTKGARHILLLNLPPLGRVPIAQDFDAVDELTESSNKHNELLKQNVETWKTTYPDVHFMLFDVYQGLMEMLNDPAAYGYNNTTGRCDEKMMDVLQTEPMTKELADSTCDGYMFFDYVHPSEAVHQELANRVARLLHEDALVFE